jgi:hypothetical protein
MKKQILSEEIKRMQYLAGIINESKLNENNQPKIGDKVDVFNPKGKYSKESWWGPDEYLNNAEIIEVNGQKITVKDINDDEYEVDLTDIS